MSAVNALALSRRGFLQTAACTAAAHVFAPAVQALSQPGNPISRLAYRAGEAGIEILSIRAERPGADMFQQVGLMPCEAPTALHLLPAARILYVAHGTGRFQHLPCGSVGSYRVDVHSGTLSPLHRERLSLACTQPEALAISPDGTLLVVASGRAGILNVLPIDRDGRPGPVTVVRKELQWKTAEGGETMPITARFVGDRTFAVTSPSQQTNSLYKCSDEAIMLVKHGTMETKLTGNGMLAGPAFDRTLVWL